MFDTSPSPALFAAREPSMLWYSSISCSADHGRFGRFQSENRPKDFQIWRLIKRIMWVMPYTTHDWEWFIYTTYIFMVMTAWFMKFFYPH
jgi:hypothetical protein